MDKVNEKPNFLNYRFYDAVTAAVLTNVMAEYNRDEGLYINGYEEGIPDTFYLIQSITASDILQEPIHMIMPLVPYLQFRRTHWKDRKRFKWRVSYLWSKPMVTPIGDIMDFVKQEFKIDDGKLLEIIKAYYPKWEEWIR